MNTPRPNILWISTHDTSARHYGCYGDTFGHTPNIDRLAAEGVRYANAFTAGPICSPSRTSIYTGMHPTTLGTHHHRSAVIRPKEVELLPKMLTDAGYACTKPDEDINLYISKAELYQYHDLASIWDRGQGDEPFFAHFKLGDAHASVFKLTPETARKERSYLLSDDERHDPLEVPVPSFVPDVPTFRERMAQFLDAITNVDKQVGKILAKLEEKGLSESTIVVFWGDHGSGYPRGKIHCYDDGLKIPLIMRIPGNFRHLAPVPPGSVVDDLVMHMDLAPTTLQMAGIPIPDHIQGRTLCDQDEKNTREFVCSARDRLDNNPEMIRTIRTKKYRYIRNFMPHQPYASFYPDGGFFSRIPQEGTPEREFWETSVLPGDQKLHDPDGVFLILGPPVMVNQNGLPEDYKQVLFWQDHKPHEELYDIEDDLEEINNLASDPAFGDVRDDLRSKLYGWMIETRDLGLIDEPEIVSRAAAHEGISHAVGVQCDNFERILETADLARLGEAGKEELVSRLNDPDNAVRFWAVTGLFSFESNPDLKPLLAERLDDASISVGLAAATHFVRMGEGERASEVFARALRSDILWTRLRAGAYLSYCSKEQLRPMKPLIPVLQAAGENKNIFGPEHDLYAGTSPFIQSVRDMIAKVWVLNRVARRIELSVQS